MSSLSPSLIEEYISYYLKYTKEYGDKTCILLQNGIFYEMIMVKNDKECIGNLIEVCGLLNIQVSRKNKSIETIDRKNPLFGGFQKISMSKYLPILLDNGFTVVVIDQDDINSNAKKKRSVTGIYSPGIQPMDIIEEKTGDGNNISSILFDIQQNKKDYVIGYSICNVNMSTNSFDTYEMFQTIIHESFENVLDEVYRILLRYNTKELLVYTNKNNVPKHFQKDYLINYLDIPKVHWKCESLDEQNTATYQNMFFKKVYKNVNFGLLTPIEYFNLECRQLTSLNCIKLVEFIANHDHKYVNNIASPTIINEYKYLSMPLNTIRQLNIISTGNHRFSSLFSVINKTRTAIGKRALKQLLCKPYKTYEEIQHQFDFNEAMQHYDYSKIQKSLDDICDFDKLHRKLDLGMLHPFELRNLYISYQNILELVNVLESSQSKVLIASNLDHTTKDKLVNLVEELKNTFNITELKKYNLNESNASVGNYFNSGIVPELDTIFNNIYDIESEIERTRVNYDKIVNGSDWIKVACDQEGYMYTCTKIRFELLKSKLGKEFKCLSLKQQTNNCKFTTEELKTLSLQLLKSREILAQKIKAHFISYLTNFSATYSTTFTKLRQYIEKLDISQSNAVCTKSYNYCKPTLKQDTESFLQAKDMRHAIIERVNEDTPYVPNDISLTKDSNGMLLYALNSCGKSSLLKSLGICVILAQCGLYVPCSQFVFSPFETLISQVDSQDNLWKCQSSFVTEMIGLRKIQKVANEKCLVLADELTHSTEHLSATALFTMSVLDLIAKKSKFVFTTHLHEVANLEEIKTNKHLQICHLSVDVKNDSMIVFERKIKPGPCDSLYGLEIAKAVGLNEEFISSSFNIRNRLLNKKQKVLNTQKSKYNAKKIVDECEICGYSAVKKTDMPLDVHHIEFQCTADNNNFTGHFHKNSKFNLVTLCKMCHQKVHSNVITIHGYIQTTNGVKLDYEDCGQ